MSKEIVKGYALALFSIAKEEKKLQKIKTSSSIVLQALNDNKDYLDILRTKIISFEEKQKLVGKAFKGIDILIRNFILLATEKSKAHHIPHVFQMLITYINEELDVHEGVVYTPSAITQAEIKKIEVKVSKILGFKPELINKLDVHLLSGFKVVIDDEIVEDSYISRLHQIKEQLKGGKNA